MNPATHGPVANCAHTAGACEYKDLLVAYPWDSQSQWSTDNFCCDIFLRIAYGKLTADRLCVELTSSPHLHWALIFNQGYPQSDRGANGRAGLGRRGIRWRHENVSRQRFRVFVYAFETPGAGGAGNTSVVVGQSRGRPPGKMVPSPCRGRRILDMLATYQSELLLAGLYASRSVSDIEVNFHQRCFNRAKSLSREYASATSFRIVPDPRGFKHQNASFTMPIV